MSVEKKKNSKNSKKEKREKEENNCTYYVVSKVFYSSLKILLLLVAGVQRAEIPSRAARIQSQAAVLAHGLILNFDIGQWQ